MRLYAALMIWGEILFKNNYVSIDIGNKNIKIVEAKKTTQNIIIDKCIMSPTPNNSFNNGEFYEFENIKKEIFNNLIENKIKAKKAVCTVDSTNIISRELILPFAEGKELDNLVRFEIEEYLPIMLNEYVIEYKVLEVFNISDIKKVKVLVAALPKKIADNYYNLLKELHLNPVALDLNSNAVSKIIKNCKYINDEKFSLDQTVAIIDFGFTFTNVSVISEGVIKINKLFLTGSKDIDLNIANSFNLSLDESEMKKKENVNISKNIENSISETMLNEIVTNSIDTQINQIQKIFQYFTSRTTGNKIDNIYIYGGGSNLNGIEDYFFNYFNIPTKRINNIDYIKFNNSNCGLEYFLNCISAIVRE